MYLNEISMFENISLHKNCDNTINATWAMDKTVFSPVMAAILWTILDFLASSRVITSHPLHSWSEPPYISQKYNKVIPPKFWGVPWSGYRINMVIWPFEYRAKDVPREVCRCHAGLCPVPDVARSSIPIILPTLNGNAQLAKLNCFPVLTVLWSTYDSDTLQSNTAGVARNENRFLAPTHNLKTFPL